MFYVTMNKTDYRPKDIYDREGSRFLEFKTKEEAVAYLQENGLKPDYMGIKNWLLPEPPNHYFNSETKWAATMIQHDL